MRRRWVYIEGEAHEVVGDGFVAPQSPLVMPDIQPYRSMVDGSMIGGRRQHREHLRAHGVVEIGNEKFPARKIAPPPGLKQRLIEVFNSKT